MSELLSTTKSVVDGNIHPFAHADSHVNERGNRVYWASTWLQSESPNGRYEIEQVSYNHYVVKHYQVIRRGADVIVRPVGTIAKTKGYAMSLAEADSHHLANNVLSAVLIAGDQCFGSNPERESFVMPTYSGVK
jgi:hypothetical protein